MAQMRLKGLTLLLLCIGISLLWSFSLRRNAPTGTTPGVDFREIYYGARCAIQNRDPYQESEVLREYQAEGGTFPSTPAESVVARIVITIGVNLPTTLFLAAPFAMLPWTAAQMLWTILIAGTLFLAAFLMMDAGSDAAPAIAGCLAGFFLLNCEILLIVGNVAGIAVSLCIVAAWCVLRGRLVLAGVLCLALSLVLKPHDAGFVWLYFLMAGGELRKRALQTLAVAGVLGLLAAVWIPHFSPHWIQELHANLVTTLKHGGLNDPGAASLTGRSVGMVISLQAFFSVLRDDPHFYNPMSYLVSGALLLVWAITAVRTRFTQEGAWLALAAVSALSLLPVYHRPYDAKLLLLAVPACAMLWAGGGMRRWLALGVTSAGIISTSDIPLAILVTATKNLHFSTTTLAGKLMTILLLRPTPLILLAMGCFYLWVYVRYDPDRVSTPERDNATERPTAPATT